MAHDGGPPFLYIVPCCACSEAPSVVFGLLICASWLRCGHLLQTAYLHNVATPSVPHLFFSQVLAAVRSGLLAAASTSEQAAGGGLDSTAADTVEDVPTMTVGAAGHSDILREASHYLSAIKVCTAAVLLV